MWSFSRPPQKQRKLCFLLVGLRSKMFFRRLSGANEPGRDGGEPDTRVSLRQPLRDQPSQAKREELLEQYYIPHHQKLIEAVEESLLANDHCLIINGHSFPIRLLYRHGWLSYFRRVSGNGWEDILELRLFNCPESAIQWNHCPDETLSQRL